MRDPRKNPKPGDVVKVTAEGAMHLNQKARSHYWRVLTVIDEAIIYQYAAENGTGTGEVKTSSIRQWDDRLSAGEISLVNEKR